jgi:hypothetical protein
MRGFLRVFASGLALAGLVVACGARTGLSSSPNEPVGDATPDRPTDATVDGDARSDAPTDGPLFEGGPLDVKVDCPDPPTCDPNDLGFVYQCGVRVYQCSSLETCSQGKCVNPCLDTLGQDTSNGCEFYAAPIDLTEEGEGSCYAVFIVNQWATGEPAKIQVERGGQTLNVDQFARIPQGTGTSITYAPYSNAQGLAKDQIAILFLSRDPQWDALPPGDTRPKKLAACPPGVTPAVVGDPAVKGTGIGQAFRIKTNVPVVAYQIMPFGGGRARITSASLLLPKNVWGTNYVTMNAYASPQLGGARIGPTLMIFGQEDGTTVRLRPTVPLVGGNGLAGSPAGVTATYTLNQGTFIQFTQAQELSGTPIESDKPIAVVGGNTLVQVPVGRARADGAHQMLFPIRALGNEYAAVRYRSRGQAQESVPWRLGGVANGTILTYEPAQPVGAPSVLQAGQVAEFNATGPFVVRSQDAQHPFYFAQYMTGGGQTGEFFDGEGDPEFVNVLTPAQFLPRYVFFTDPTYPETNLVVLRAKDEVLGVFPSVDLDCAGTLTGWQPVGTQGKYEFVRVDLSRDNFQGVGQCNNGVHRIEGKLPPNMQNRVAKIAVTVWGWGSARTYSGTDESNPLQSRWVSYGYPVGANIADLNTVTFPAQ